MLNIFRKKGKAKIKREPLKTKGLVFSYNDKEILRDLNLTVKHSTMISIVGKSGEGKSTFLNLIVGALTKDYKGSIKILGNERNLAKEDIGYVPQENAFIPDLTIEENVIFFGRLNGLGKEKAMAKGKELMKILKMNIPLLRTAKDMSGGQKVRLNILLSFLHEPKVLILDEPFVGLDYLNRKLLWNFLTHQKRRKKTIILTTHMLSEAEHFADSIVILQKGKVIAKGKFEDICQKLKTNFISEIKFGYLSKSKEKEMRDYCQKRDIVLIDAFKSHFMFSLKSQGQRNYLLRFVYGLDVEYEETAFRKPNLDELSMKVSSS